MLAFDPTGILEQILGCAGIHLTQESTQDDHALIDRLIAQQVGINLVPGMRLAGASLRSDRRQSQLAHQSSDAPTSAGNPLAQQCHLKPPTAVYRVLGENSVEPVQQIKLARQRRARPIVEAAARDPEQRALPAYGQRHVRHDHCPPLSKREMEEGCSVKNRVRPVTARSCCADRR